MQQSVLVVVVVVDQLHDRVELGALLDRDSVPGVGADAVMPAASLEADRQSRRLFVRLLDRRRRIISISIIITTKGGSRRLEKSHKVWMMMMMMIAASLTWAGAADKPEQSKIIFKNYQNDSKQFA